VIVQSLEPNTAPEHVREKAAAFTLKVACPLVWHDRTESWPKLVSGATCFFLQFEQETIGVTANHVIQAYEAAFCTNRNLVCQLRTSRPFDVVSSTIDRNPDLDIATFRVPDEVLAETERIALDCRGNWPAPTPGYLRALSLCGFPEALRTPAINGGGTFQAWGALPAVDDITDREILITYDPERDGPILSVPTPPLGFNLSGCSGGPVLMHNVIDGVHHAHPVGMMTYGPKDGEKGGISTEFDMIRLRRIHFVQRDGTIPEGNSGWRPS
jgi:hypothetical protein